MQTFISKSCLSSMLIDFIITICANAWCMNFVLIIEQQPVKTAAPSDQLHKRCHQLNSMTSSRLWWKAFWTISLRMSAIVFSICLLILSSTSDSGSAISFWPHCFPSWSSKILQSHFWFKSKISWELIRLHSQGSMGCSPSMSAYLALPQPSAQKHEASLRHSS